MAQLQTSVPHKGRAGRAGAHPAQQQQRRWQASATQKQHSGKHAATQNFPGLFVQLFLFVPTEGTRRGHNLQKKQGSTVEPLLQPLF
eukprot:1070811-Pelagomonas_calceolata.AAC.4